MGVTYDTAFPVDDPRSWRNECVNPAEPRLLADILDAWKAEYVSLRWIGFPRSGFPHIWIENDAGFKVSTHRAIVYISLSNARIPFLTISIIRGHRISRTSCGVMDGQMRLIGRDARRL